TSMAAPMSSSGMTSMTLRIVDSTKASTTRARYCRYLTQSSARGCACVGVGGVEVDPDTSVSAVRGPRLVVVLVVRRRVGGVRVLLLAVLVVLSVVVDVLAARGPELALQCGEVRGRS